MISDAVGSMFQFLKRFDSRNLSRCGKCPGCRVSIPQKVRFKGKLIRFVIVPEYCFNSSKGSIQGILIDIEKPCPAWFQFLKRFDSRQATMTLLPIRPIVSIPQKVRFKVATDRFVIVAMQCEFQFLKRFDSRVRRADSNRTKPSTFQFLKRFDSRLTVRKPKPMILQPFQFLKRFDSRDALRYIGG